MEPSELPANENYREINHRLSLARQYNQQMRHHAQITFSTQGQCNQEVEIEA